MLPKPTAPLLPPAACVSAASHAPPLQPACFAGILVDDATEAYRISTASGGIGVRAPVTLKDEATGQVGGCSDWRLR